MMKTSIYLVLFLSFYIVGFVSAQVRVYGGECGCSKQNIPFCGTDGVTYLNKCSLECAQRLRRGLRVKFEGVCAIPYKENNGGGGGGNGIGGGDLETSPSTQPGVWVPAPNRGQNCWNGQGRPVPCADGGRKKRSPEPIPEPWNGVCRNYKGYRVPCAGKRKKRSAQPEPEPWNGICRNNRGYRVPCADGRRKKRSYLNCWNNYGKPVPCANYY